MHGKLASQIKQSKPFETLEEEAALNLLRTADALIRSEEGLFTNLELSPQQYNVLRILRGAGSDGLPCGEIGSRMLTRDPDITRLLDRLEKRGFTSRARDCTDRRVVTARITREGLSLLAGLDEPVRKLHEKNLGHMGQRKLKLLIELLEEAREGK